MYQPNPVDTTDVVLSADLLELTEEIAENVHEVWAQGRIREGWTYGAERNDTKKETPCLVPYNQLPESEKAYDRNTALETVKLIVKLGYDIKKKTVDFSLTEQEMAKKITDVYAAFGIKIGPLLGVLRGAETSRFDFEVNTDAAFPKIRKLRDDVSLFLSVPPVELTCPIPGKMAFGIEISNK